MGKNVEFGEFIQKSREILGKSKRGLAAEIGVTHPYIIKTEKGSIPTANIMKKLANALHIPFKILIKKAHNIDIDKKVKEDTEIITSIYEGLDNNRKETLFEIIKLFGQEVKDDKKTGD